MYDLIKSAEGQLNFNFIDIKFLILNILDCWTSRENISAILAETAAANARAAANLLDGPIDIHNIAIERCFRHPKIC